jgi:phage baseplate assembly protein W
MLYVTLGSDGVDTGTTITSHTLAGRSTERGATIAVDAFVHEDDATLLSRYVSAVLYWNDGSAPISFPRVAGGLLHVQSTKSLVAGSYVAALHAQNYKSPVEDVEIVNFFITVSPATTPENPPNYVFGPILPRDSGFPNLNQWEFNLNSDLYILESSVKMLLLTAKGDRVMEPTYGTNIRKILFEMNIKGVDSLVKEEVVSALALWEPRLEVVGVAVNRDSNNRSAELNIVLVSKLNKQAFETSVSFVR